MLLLGQFLLWRCPPPSVPHTPNSNYVNGARGFQDINFQKELARFLVFSFFFLSRHESYHKVEMGYPIALKFGTLKGGVRAYLGIKFG